MYYGIVAIAVMLFGLQFFCNQEYQRESGSGAAASMLMVWGSSALGAVVLLAVNKFQLGFTPYTLFLAAVTALNNIACTVCSLKALGRINLSMYSLFSMLGGMVLPFCAGILFYREPFGWGKALCFLTVVGALLLTLQKDESKGGGLYYAGIFVFNGMSGVLSKIYQASTFPKANEASYSFWSALLSAAFAGAIWSFLRDRKVKMTEKTVLWLGGSGALNKVANLFLLLALAKLPASVQYPMVTGGVMIVSTLLSYFTAQKPRLREIGAVALSFIGILFLFI